jgi:predicted DNA-binding transcriptional regulator YafY
MSTSARMLRLLSLLQTHRHWPGTELAERLEVSQRTLRRDVERLRELGYPVNAGRGVGGGYQLRPGAALPPLLLDDDEAVAIAVGLRTAAGGSVAGIEEISLRALTKLTSVLPPRLRRRVDALQAYVVPTVIAGPTIAASSLTVLAQACRDQERVRFRYAAPGREPQERTAEPHRLVSSGRRWYLVAWDIVRADWRTFRIDRLADPVLTGGTFHPRELPGGDAADFVRDAVASAPRHEVVVAVRAPAGQVQAVVAQWGFVEAMDDATCLLRMQVDSFDWPAMVLGAIGADFQVRQPPELAHHLAGIGRRFARAAV